MSGAGTIKLQCFHILLALAGGPLHGNAIQRAVLERTDGKLTIWPATLYRLLSDLSDQRLLRPASAPVEAPHHEQRRYYSLTKAGRERLARDASRLADWADAALRLTSAAKP